MERTDQLQVDDDSSVGDRLSLHAPNPSIECTQQLQLSNHADTFELDNSSSELILENSSEDKHKSKKQLTTALSANIECTHQLQIGQRICITKTRTQNLSHWIGHEATVTGINEETISVLAGEGREKKHLTLKQGWYEVIPKNFLEENQEAVAPAQSLKPSKQKGCLYKYLENKKLKNGSIVSYPRIIEDKRDPDKPQHWRWGFNWEEKIDGEWKGRSIGSIPVGAIAIIKSMQNQGVALEEIIAFIKKSKAKK
ncbi:C-5 cytosine-specific DNA methylase (plasmid) [Calothrix brevissima NIES-22]|nr:C-5 cytosine-specific DNA methylase [Calothrix brevissima NIES-22]